MKLQQVIDELAARGTDARDHQIGYAIKSGRIDRPSMDRSLCFDFEPKHVDQLQAWFESPRRPGPVPRTESATA